MAQSDALSAALPPPTTAAAAAPDPASGHSALGWAWALVLVQAAPQRMDALPKIATMSEQGIKDEVFQVTGWLGMSAPASTPPEVVARLGRELQAVIAMPEVRERNYLEHLLSLDRTAKELRVFDLGPALLERQQDLFAKVLKRDQSLQQRRARGPLILHITFAIECCGCVALAVLSLGDGTHLQGRRKIVVGLRATVDRGE